MERKSLKSVQKNVRFTEKEAEDIKKKAKQEGLTMSEYMREAILSYQERKKQNKLDKEYKELLRDVAGAVKQTSDVSKKISQLIELVINKK